MSEKQKLNHNLRALLVVLVAVLGVGNAWAFSGSASYSIKKTSDTPNGAGMIYGYRGGGDGSSSGTRYLEGDMLKTGGFTWVNAETGMNINEMTIKQDEGQNYSPNNDNRPDGYEKMDRRKNQNGAQTIHVLHMYFYAKPNPGYQFDGWFENDDGTGALTGSTDHYPYPLTATSGEGDQFIHTYSPTRWDNGNGSTLPAEGPYGGEFYYLRYVQKLTKDQATASKTMYAKFSIIPRHVMFVGTGFADVSYTAGGTNVGATNVESENITKDIELKITYDADKYNFNGWQWSLGQDGAKTDIASTASATYTFVVNRGYPTATYNSNTGGYDYEQYTKVYIQPLLTEKVDYVAEVTHNAVTTSYATWDAAFKAAKETGVSGAVITLKKDVAGITTVQTVDRDMTLNLNGHSITGSVNNMFTVSSGNFTLCDNTPAAAGRIVQNVADATGTTYALTVASGATLTLNSGGILATGVNNVENSAGTSRGVLIQSGGTLVMSGGEIRSQSTNNAYALWNSGTATISGGVCQAYAKGTSTKGTGKTAVAFYSVGTSGTINGGTFTATADSTTSYGIQHNVASKTLTINYAISTATAGKSGAVALQRTNGKIMVKGGKYKASSVLNTANKSYIELQGGIYSTWTNVRQSCATDYDCYELQPGADWNDGYRFEVIAATANPRVCKILEVGKSTSYYTSLSDALTYANNNTGSVMSIILIAFEHTLPAGNYTLPQRADLVVPYSVDQTGVVGASPVRVTSNSTPSAFRKLTLASGVNIDAFGKIEAGGRQSLSGTAATGAGIPSGAYGWLVLQNGSKITLENGSQLSAWGFVTGSGEIDARRGSTVYEQFQMYGWMGGTNASGMYSKTFPITQYFIQNVEAPVKYHPGARLITATGVAVTNKITNEIEHITTNSVNVIGVDGDVAMFLMANEDDSEDTWVRRRYDVATDRQVYEINSSARLGSLRITLEDVPLLGTIDMDSRNYTLPITNNMKIHLLTGEMGITQSTMMLAGTQIEVDKEATANIASGQSLYLYDDAEWGNYAFKNALAHRIKYRPEATPKAAQRDISSAAALGDAKLFVHGTFDVKGKLYTTATGSNIYSTNEDAGTIKFTSSAASSNSSMTMYSGDGTATTTVNAVPALLRNANNSTTATSGTAAGKSFAYSDGKWQCWTQDGCFFVDNTNTYYAKPADYVALLNGKTENADHTYTSADGTRTFILVDGCQWWEVEIEDAETGVWHCVHPLNDVYYYHNGTTWVVKTVSVTWLNWDGSVITTYNNVPYKSTPVYNSTTPTRKMDAYYTYDFAGWSPALGPVTSNTSFTAQFTSRDRKYTIVFKNEDGSVRETKYCTMGQIPVCTNPPTKEGFKLVWSPTIEAVTGDATYTATFTKEVQAAYHVTFKNYNNTVVLQEGDVATGTMPVYSGATPTKPATTDKTFTHNGWEPALHNVDADVIYTPTFSEAPREYTITWLNDDNSQIDQTHVAYGTLPTHADATKSPSGGYTYTFDGWTPAPVSVVGDATYKAKYIAVAVPTYTLTVSATPAGYGTVSHSSVSDISSGSAVTTSSNTFTVNGTTVTATPTAQTAQYTYSFDRWNNLPATVTANVANVEAVFTRSTRSYTILFKDGDGNTLTNTPANNKWEYGTKPTYTGATTPTKAEDATNTYTFNGTWSDGTNTYATANLPTVTGDKTYTAQFTANQKDIGAYLDIVDWSGNGSGQSLTLNMNGYSSDASGSAWKVSVAGSEKKTKTDREDNRTLVFSGLTLTAGEQITITAYDDNDNIESHHRYTVPHIYTSNTELNANTGFSDQSIVYVSAGKLILDTDLKVKKMIVCPGAELVVNSKLTCTYLVLRTEAYKSAILTDNGTINADTVYYTRRVADKINTYPFGLPFKAYINADTVKLSNGVALTHGTHYGLLEYDGESRANRGKADDNHSNWKMLTTTTLTAGKGYQLASTSSYYYELYFPVDYDKTSPERTVSVSYHTGDAGKMAAGWNYIVSPFTQVYDCESFEQPEELLKISVLDSKTNIYDQYVPNAIQPATPFFYQADASGLLVFDANRLHKLAPRRMGIYNPSNDVPTQWIELLFGNAADELDIFNNADRTNIYLHPTKFSAEYELGYDVTKLSTQGAHPLLWVKTTAGDLAFAALPDTLAQSLPLTVSVPAEGAYTFALNENDYTSRVENIILLDALTGTETDLRKDTYTCLIEEGQTTARFFLNVKMKQQGVTTEVDDIDSKSSVDRPVKLFIDGYIYILMPDGRMYDAVGKRVK